MRTRLMIAGAITVGIALTAAWWPPRDPGLPPNVVLIVLDTVRSDYLSMCGETRPTSPNLDAFAARWGASATCDGIAPGSWTLPSHASFFTGLTPLEHHAHAITTGVKSFKGSGSRARGLGKHPKTRKQTLAELFNERGYETLAVSANPVVGKSLGLIRGFERHTVTDKFENMRGQAVTDALDTMLGSLDAERPTFLFVNIADAHQAWEPVPKQHAWATDEKAPRKYKKLSSKSLWRRMVEHRMKEPEAAKLRSALDEIYAYNLNIADENLGRALESVEAAGLCDHRCRIVVVSDHGEMLGERDLLDHGHYLWNTNVRVPLAFWSVEQGRFWSSPLHPPPALDTPINALHAYHLAVDGKLPETLAEPISMAWPHVRRCFHTKGSAFCDTSAAIWSDGEKHMWSIDPKGEDERFVVVEDWTDPDDSIVTPMGPDHPGRAALENLARRVQADSGAKEETSSEVEEALKAFGYVD